MKINKNLMYLVVFLAMFGAFTIPIAPVSADMYNKICQNNYLHQEAMVTIDGSEIEIEIDPIKCQYGCTNLTYPAQCVESPHTDTFTMPFISTPLFLLFEIIALVLLGVGMFYRTGTEEMVVLFPIISTVMFIALSVSAINIDGISNPMVMWFNFGFFMLALVASVYGYMKKPMENIGSEEIEEM